MIIGIGLPEAGSAKIAPAMTIAMPPTNTDAMT